MNDKLKRAMAITLGLTMLGGSALAGPGPGCRNRMPNGKQLGAGHNGHQWRAANGVRFGGAANGHRWRAANGIRAGGAANGLRWRAANGMRWGGAANGLRWRAANGYAWGSAPNGYHDPVAAARLAQAMRQHNARLLSQARRQHISAAQAHLAKALVQLRKLRSSRQYSQMTPAQRAQVDAYQASLERLQQHYRAAAR